MVNDAQTHDLPQDAEGIDRLGADDGRGRYRRRGASADRRGWNGVADLTEGFFAPSETWHRPRHQSKLARDRRRLAQLSRRCARHAPPRYFSRVRAGDPAPPAARGQRRRGADRLRRLPCRAACRCAAVFAVRGQPAADRSDRRYLRPHRPRSPRYLSRNAGVLDAVIGGEFLCALAGRCRRWPRPWRHVLAAIPDYETQARRSAGAGRRNGISASACITCAGLIDASEAGKQYADLAEAVLAALWPVVAAEFRPQTRPAAGARRGGAGHGQPGGRAAERGLRSRPDRDL